MKVMLIMFTVGVLFWYAPATAEIYSWVDADGVRHYSNTPPPEASKKVSVSKEVVYDEKKDKKRVARDRRQIRQRPRPAKEKKLTPQEKAKIDKEIRLTWEKHRKALVEGDIDGATKHIHKSTREHYREIYKEIDRQKRK